MNFIEEIVEESREVFKVLDAAAWTNGEILNESVIAGKLTVSFIKETASSVWSVFVGSKSDAQYQGAAYRKEGHIIAGETDVVGEQTTLWYTSKPVYGPPAEIVGDLVENPLPLEPYFDLHSNAVFVRNTLTFPVCGGQILPTGPSAAEIEAALVALTDDGTAHENLKNVCGPLPLMPFYSGASVRVLAIVTQSWSGDPSAVNYGSWDYWPIEPVVSLYGLNCSLSRTDIQWGWRTHYVVAELYFNAFEERVPVRRRKPYNMLLQGFYQSLTFGRGLLTDDAYQVLTDDEGVGLYE